MNNLFLIFAALGLGTLVYLTRKFFDNSKDSPDAQILDITRAILAKESKLKEKEKVADDAMKEYERELKKYDPNFHSDDDSDGKPSA